MKCSNCHHRIGVDKEENLTNPKYIHVTLTSGGKYIYSRECMKERCRCVHPRAEKRHMYKLLKKKTEFKAMEAN